jgi:excisionase family DNA binding protein
MYSRHWQGFFASYEHIATVQGLLDCWASSDRVTCQKVNEMSKLTDYLHTAAAAEYIGVAQNTLRKWAARGDIPMHRNPANGYRLFKRSDLEKFLNKASTPIKPLRTNRPK